MSTSSEATVQEDSVPELDEAVEALLDEVDDEDIYQAPPYIGGISP